MSITHRCKLCGKTTVDVYSLSGTIKTPLCSEDIQAYTSSLPPNTKHVILPIGSFFYVRTESDYKQFQLHQLQMSKAINFADQLIDKEKANAEETLDALERGKKDMLEAVAEDFDVTTNKVRNFHAGIDTALAEARQQLFSARDVKDYALSHAVRALVKCSEVGRLPDLYKGWVQDALPMVKNALGRAFHIPQAEPQAYLMGVLQGKEDVSPPLPSPYVSIHDSESASASMSAFQQNRPIPRPAQRLPPRPINNGYQPPPFRVYPSSINYQLCQAGLNSDNSVLASGHEECYCCFDCISKATRTYVKCPICKIGYPVAVRVSLEQRIPGLIKVISKKRLKKLEGAMSLPGDSCACVVCCQCTVIANCQGKPGACPKCGIVYTEEVFADFHRSKHHCSGCQCQLVLTNVADYVRDDSGIRYYCYTCKESGAGQLAYQGATCVWR